MNTITIKDQTLGYLGDASMLLCPLTTFLCSHRVPDGVAPLVLQWVETLNPADTCVVCGNLSGNERYALVQLVRKGIPVVLALAQAVPEQIEALRLDSLALELVVVSPIIDPTIQEANGKTSAARNRLMIAMAEQIVVSYMTEHGNLAQQLLMHRNVRVLYTQGAGLVLNEREIKQEAHLQTSMGWTIYRSLTAELPSQEVRKLLYQYVNLKDIERPSLLHSLILAKVVRLYGRLNDFDFTSFLRYWRVQTLRAEDWKAQKVNDKWVPSLAEKVLSRLFKVIPDKYNQPVNPNEVFDPALAHYFLDMAFNNLPRKQDRLLRKALKLAYYEHDSEAIAKYRDMIKPKE